MNIVIEDGLAMIEIDGQRYVAVTSEEYKRLHSIIRGSCNVRGMEAAFSVDIDILMEGGHLFCDLDGERFLLVRPEMHSLLAGEGGCSLGACVKCGRAMWPSCAVKGMCTECVERYLMVATSILMAWEKAGVQNQDGAEKAMGQTAQFLKEVRPLFEGKQDAQQVS